MYMYTYIYIYIYTYIYIYIYRERERERHHAPILALPDDARGPRVGAAVGGEDRDPALPVVGLMFRIHLKQQLRLR